MFHFAHIVRPTYKPVLAHRGKVFALIVQCDTTAMSVTFLHERVDFGPQPRTSLLKIHLNIILSVACVWVPQVTSYL